MFLRVRWELEDLARKEIQLKSSRRVWDDASCPRIHGGTKNGVRWSDDDEDTVNTKASETCNRNKEDNIHHVDLAFANLLIENTNATSVFVGHRMACRPVVRLNVESPL